jgi:hypothetical protein
MCMDVIGKIPELHIQDLAHSTAFLSYHLRNRSI